MPVKCFTGTPIPQPAVSDRDQTDVEDGWASPPGSDLLLYVRSAIVAHAVISSAHQRPGIGLVRCDRPDSP